MVSKVLAIFIKYRKRNLDAGDYIPTVEKNKTI